MRIHLDTNYLALLKLADSVEARRTAAWIVQRAELGTSTIAWTEFLCGPLNLGEDRDVRGIVGAPVPFEEQDARLAAELFNRSGRRRHSLADCQIAATAIRSQAWLATGDVAGFAPFSAAGLRLLTDRAKN